MFDSHSDPRMCLCVVCVVDGVLYIKHAERRPRMLAESEHYSQTAVLTSSYTLSPCSMSSL